MARSFLYIGYGVVSIGMVLTPLPAWPEITVIYDSGDTRPLAPYLEIIEAALGISHYPVLVTTQGIEQ